MILRNFAFSALCLFTVFSQSAGGQEKQPKLVDEFASNLCSDDFRGRIDLFLASISEEPKSIGWVVITPDSSMPGRSIKYEKMISAHVGFRRFDRDRIKISRRPSGTSSIQFWVMPSESNSASDDSGIAAAIPAMTLFDASWIASVKGDEVEFGEPWGNEPCDFGLFLDQFASALSVNSELTAHLIAASDKRLGKKAVERALLLTAKTLTQKHGIPPTRIRTSYAGKRKDAEMQLWMIPRNGVPPTFREDATKWE